MILEPLIGWTKLLEDAYPELNYTPTVDWDGDGRIESYEVVDSNSDFHIDDAEARQFILNPANRNLIAERIPFSRFVEESGFSPKNPIHDYILYDLQTEQMSGADIQAVYSELKWVLDYVRARYDENMTPEEKLLLVREAMIENGAVFGVESDRLTDAIMSGAFDCDTGFYVLQAVAYEFGWPVEAVRAPAHLFARWNEGGGYINFEIQEGFFPTDDNYVSKLNIDPVSVSRGDLAGKSQPELNDLYLYVEANTFYKNGLLSEAQALLSETMEAVDADPAPLSLLASIELSRGNYGSAVGYFDLSLALDPNDFNSLLWRIYAQMRLGDIRGLSQEAEHLLSLTDREPDPDESLTLVQKMTGQLSVWGEQYHDTCAFHLIDDLQEKFGALTGMLNARFYQMRGVNHFREGNLTEAIWDFSLALMYDSAHAEARAYRAEAYFNKGDYKSAIDDLNILIDQGTDVTLREHARRYRAYAYFHNGDYEKAIDDISTVIEQDLDVNARVKLYALMAVSNLKLGKFDDAADDLKKARALAPEFLLPFEDTAENRKFARELRRRLPDLNIQFI